MKREKGKKKGERKRKGKGKREIKMGNNTVRIVRKNGIEGKRIREKIMRELKRKFKNWGF